MYTLRGTKGEVLNYTPQLLFPSLTNNNIAEHEVMNDETRVLEVGAREVNIFSDSRLTNKNVNDETRVLDDILSRYKENLVALTSEF
jgi:hypothetical protein